MTDPGTCGRGETEEARSATRRKVQGSNPAVRFTIRPVTKTDARKFVTKYHRHNEAPSPMQCTLVAGLYVGDELVGIGTAGQPVARGLCDGMTLEINRTCIAGTVPNANSAIYGALSRAAKALGYRRVVTYTVHGESGASLKAAGFECVADIGSRSWANESKVRVRYDETLFGPRKNAAGLAKYRWERSF